MQNKLTADLKMRLSPSASLDINQLMTVRQFCARYPWPSEAAMRAYILKADVLGIKGAFTRVGRRILVNPARFFELIQELNNEKSPNLK